MQLQDTYHCLIRHNLLHIPIEEGYSYSLPIRAHFFPCSIWEKYKVTAIFQNLLYLMEA